MLKISCVYGVNYGFTAFIKIIQSVIWARPRHVGGQANKSALLQTDTLQTFLNLELASRTFLMVHAQTVDSFRINSFVCGNLSLPAPYFPLFQRRPTAPYRLAPRETARLVRPSDTGSACYPHVFIYRLLCYDDGNRHGVPRYTNSNYNNRVSREFPSAYQYPVPNEELSSSNSTTSESVRTLHCLTTTRNMAECNIRLAISK